MNLLLRLLKNGIEGLKFVNVLTNDAPNGNKTRNAFKTFAIIYISH